MAPSPRCIVVLVALATSVPAVAQTKPCTRADADAAEEGTSLAHGSWAALHEQYLKYAVAMDCDDGAIAEGWEDAVANLLGNAWESIPALAHLAKVDPDFLVFVVHHIGATADPEDLDRARTNALTRCPSSDSAELCRLVAESVAFVEKSVATENACNCTYDGPPKDEAEARRRLGTLASGVRWQRALRVDLTGKGVLDYVMLGKVGSEAVVGVALGEYCDLMFVFRFKKDGTKAGLCSAPANARISATALASLDDSQAPLLARGSPGTNRRGFRLQSGACAPFEFYYDGKSVTWWRR